jgi:acyl transferase domain-containing protein
MLGSLKEIYLSGWEINWGGYYRDSTHSVISLPTYPFEPKRFWLDDVDPANRQARE